VDEDFPQPGLSRYHRQMLLPEIGEEGQRRLGRSHAAIVGCGALGCTIADQLARAGIGRITLLDRDIVEWTNLQRQTLFTESDAREGLPKAEAARRRLAAINSQIDVRAMVADVTSENVEALLGFVPRAHDRAAPVDVILDGTDNFETRYLLNDVAVKHAAPLLYGGVVGTGGMVMSIVPRRTPPLPCLRCLFDDPPAPGSTPTCDTAGVLGPAAAIIASLQSVEAIKILAGRSDRLEPGLIEIDPWLATHRRLAGDRRLGCPCCGARNFEFLERTNDSAATLCGQDAIQIAPPRAPASHLQPNLARIDLHALAARLRAHGPFDALGSMLVRGTLQEEHADAPPGDRAVAQGIGLTVFADGRAIVKGTTRPERARAIYARYIGI